MTRIQIPPLVKWITAIAIIYLALMTVFRLAFFIHFKDAAHSLSNSIDAFTLGLRFDMRMACAFVLPVFLLGSLRLQFNNKKRLTLPSVLHILFIAAAMISFIFYLKSIHAGLPALIITGTLFILYGTWLFVSRNGNPFQSASAKNIWKIYLGILSAVLLFFYAVDFEHYDYLHQRLNASVFNYAEDAKISLGMVWQTYPVLKILVAIILILSLMIWLIHISYIRSNRTAALPGKNATLPYIVLFFILALGIFGRAGQYPLRWSDAFRFADDYKASLSLNPVQSFFSTLQFRKSTYDIQKVRQYYPLMAAYLSIPAPDSLRLNYQRDFPASGANGNAKTNVVVVICESFSAYKSSMWGNPLNTTPFFNQLCKEGIFFDRCFTPTFGTARGVWAVITGEPDVENPRTASRNPAAVDQHTIINDLEGYEKFYFLGGSSSWANVRALLTNNISGLRLYEEGSYKARAVDVWGISDKHLFLEANDVLKQQQKPFFAIIQTADNHRPYTIPSEDNSEFSLVKYPKDSLTAHGFDNNNELNAFRYTDFCFRKFFEAVKKEKYFNNTVFVFVGDHGIVGNPGETFPKCWTEMGLTRQHVPLLFYSPSLLQPRRMDVTCSQLDVLPSVAALVGSPYHNTTLGRNLFDMAAKTVRFPERAFLFNPDERKIGIITNDYCYMRDIDTGKENLMPAKNNDSLPLTLQTVSDKKILQDLTNAYFETGKYMLLHNAKKSVAQ